MSRPSIVPTPRRSQKLPQAGFTIIELMIATMVFSVILIVITAGIIAVTKTYYKGVTLNKTQGVARDVMNAVAQSIQFSGQQPKLPANNPDGSFPTSGRICFGNQAYDFQQGYQLNAAPGNGDLHANHVLALSPDIPNCNPSTSFANPLPSGATELMAPNMRLGRFDVKQLSATDQLYQIDVTVIYGDYDLLCDAAQSPATDPGGCAPGAAPYTGTTSQFQAFMARPHLTCRTGADSAYCAVSALSTVVEQRLVPN